MATFSIWYENCYMFSQKGENMSSILIELLREKQDWIENNKCRNSNSSWISNTLVVLASVIISVIVFKIIQNPDVFSKILNLF